MTTNPKTPEAASKYLETHKRPAMLLEPGAEAMEIERVLEYARICVAAALSSPPESEGVPSDDEIDAIARGSCFPNDDEEYALASFVAKKISARYAAELNRVTKERDEVREAVKPFVKLAEEIQKNSGFKPGQNVFAYNGNGFTTTDLGNLLKALKGE